MASVSAQLKDLRQQVEALQVEVAGRQHISSMVIWDEQKQPSVNQKTSRIQENFSGLIIHLTPEVSTPEETLTDHGISQNEFNELREELVRAIS